MTRPTVIASGLYSLPAWACALALAGALVGVGAVEQWEADAAQAWRESQRRVDATFAQMQAEQNASHRAQREAAAQALCREELGESLAVWVSDTAIKCIPRRGHGRKTFQIQ
jgi:hypothetical protein